MKPCWCCRFNRSGAQDHIFCEGKPPAEAVVGVFFGKVLVIAPEECDGALCRIADSDDVARARAANSRPPDKYHVLTVDGERYVVGEWYTHHPPYSHWEARNAEDGVVRRTLVEHTRIAWLKEHLASLEELIAASEHVLKVTDHPRAWESKLNRLRAIQERLSAALASTERGGDDE